MGTTWWRASGDVTSISVAGHPISAQFGHDGKSYFKIPDEVVQVAAQMDNLERSMSGPPSAPADVPGVDSNSLTQAIINGLGPQVDAIIEERIRASLSHIQLIPAQQ